MNKSTFLAMTAAMAAATIMSCSIPTEEGEVGPLPDEKSFTEGKVSLFMERRCGGLDCHGQVGRPLRLYSEYGLRLKPRSDGARNTDPTTKEEQTANYQSVIGLEPEELSRCFAAGKDLEDSPGCPVEAYGTLQLLKKPLSLEGGGIRHKGGPVVSPTFNDPGWQCLYQWASGHGFPDLCQQASALE
ncbi:MAG: hypothetical protein U0270_07165 [Labilithrix sp.]